MQVTLSQPNLLKNQSYVNGEWVSADSGKTYAITNPSNGEHIIDIADLGADDTTRAVEAAEKALKGWQALTAKERSTALRRWNQLILDNQEDLGKLMTLEQGKPLAEAKGEVGYGASFIDWFADEARRLNGDVIPTFAKDKRVLTIKQGVGVVAAITPWNFPIAMITRKAGPALAAGCTIVIKPSDETPLCALALAELAHQAGIPAGVLNVVVGKSAKDIGGVLTSNPIVRKLSFTGSTPVGKLLLSQCAQTVKRTSMELGGNAPFIVFNDADLDAAVDGAMASKFRNAGQTCVCANRILVQEGIYDAFAEKLAKRVAELKTGDGFEDGVTIGPLINPAAIEKVEGLVSDALEKGAKTLTGGSTLSTTGAQFFAPTVLTDVTDEMDIFSSEIFGPVAPLFKFSTEEEAVAMANDTPFGLAAYFYSQDLSRIWRVSENLEYGMVGINEGMISSEVAPFGGVKESGSGREGSVYGIDEYVEVKYLCMGNLK
ncbi:NAD-dependent succinate-semialdehyde dehydrogenase [Marinomonas mediterranea]|jgi:succinate semialdehyde dehydrogenase (EC 1.2.1.16)|uniref:Succinic semialdehyde dehydrogenase n=1 Tax=Marinomonas mediterranea (strain ATCC 700492 / JCM 21426 / NBRC 103028 / MMB-1) TaxID=717774 RepID=F2JUM0_MARM1|nr:NAD-dependent succinate-semialdehyde dehydrogenase [Marinomonas mediterranea]ADZ89353.1 succinic semialdehyde dehydrogenase [Marinomonas mediterranea MMB-1]WCN07454.1 succinate-semialdehyde dehydrogenase [Marinomonas mediterranea]WCN15618.1 succinate-semialdehyde dehydrogenase [Marinomonas mediterranea MMB-1]